MNASNLCHRSYGFFTRSDMMSHAVSDPAHKNGGDLHHPIYNAIGKMNYASPRDAGLPFSAGRT